MAIKASEKNALVSKFGQNDRDTGSVEVQVAILTKEIVELTAHLIANKKDFSSKRGLYRKVSKRRSLLNYLKRKDIERYRKLIKELNLRH